MAAMRYKRHSRSTASKPLSLIIIITITVASRSYGGAPKQSKLPNDSQTLTGLTVTRATAGQ